MISSLKLFMIHVLLKKGILDNLKCHVIKLEEKYTSLYSIDYIYKNQFQVDKPFIKQIPKQPIATATITLFLLVLV
jgi:hypothetical protein